MSGPIVLVTGGTGFLGHNIVEALLEHGGNARVRVYSRKGPPKEESWFKEASPFDPVPTEWGQRVYPNSDLRLYKDPVTGKVYNRWKDRMGVLAEPIDGFPLIGCDSGFSALWRDPRVEVFCGDICDAEALGAAMKDCTIVIHACGDTQWWDRNNDEQSRVNMDGTATAWEVACATGVRSFLHVSTIDVLGARPPKEHMTGLCPALPDNTYADIGYNYADTKRRADDYLYRVFRSMEGRDDRPELTIVRPCSLIGAWDVTRQYGRLFASIKGGSAMAPCGSSNWLCAADAAREIVYEANKQRGAQHEPCYVNLRGYPASYKEVFEWIGESMHRASQTMEMPFYCKTIFVVPMWLLVVYGWLCQLWADWVWGEPPEINPGMARYMSQEVDLGSARDDERIKAAIETARRWYAQRGLL